MQRHLTRAFFGALVVLLFSGCDLIGVGGGYSPSGGGGSNTGEKGWPEAPAFFSPLEGEDALPNSVIAPTSGAKFLYKNGLEAFGSVSEGIKFLFRESKSDTVARPETQVEAYQVMQMTSYPEMVHNVGVMGPIDFTEHQLIELVRENKEWFQNEDYRTFAVIKIKGEIRLVHIMPSGVIIDLVDLSDHTKRPVTPVLGGTPNGGHIYVGYYWRIIVPKQG